MIILMAIQSVVFPKKYFTLRESKLWLKKHGHTTSYRGKGVHITPTQYRFRQLPPSKFKKYRSKKLKDNVILVYGF